MTDREKVIKGLEHCVEKLDTVVNKTHGFNCTTCPYFSKCDRSGYLIGLPLMHDALALLKAQEPRVMTLVEAQGEDLCWYEQKNFDSGTLPASAVIRHINIGRNQTELEFMGFEDRIVRYDADYGKAWRCWTSRPTDEQRGAVKWE